MTTKHIVLFCSLALAVGSLSVGQQPIGTPTLPDDKEPLSIIASSAGLDFVDGALRGVGPEYKAEFDRDGLLYTPALGPRASRNYPLRFTLESIRRGNTVVHSTAHSAPVTPHKSDLTAVYDRGAGILETYEVRVDGVKQSFVFGGRPAGEGDLVVRGRITTELNTEQRGIHEGGLTFTAEGIGGVNIGGVVGIDAGGVRVTGTLAFDGELLELTLPGSFVDQAAYPMVLDPLVRSSFFIRSVGEFDPDVAFNESSNNFLVVWEHQSSATNIDIYGQMIDLAGNTVGTTRLIATGTTVQVNPAVANVDLGRNFFVVWQRGGSLFGPWDIEGRRVDASASGTLSGVVQVANASGVNEITPDIGGDATLAADNVVVVWVEDGSRVRGVTVDVSTLTLGTPTTIFASVFPAGNPAISKSGGATGNLLLVWEEDRFGDWEIRGALVDRNLNILDNIHAVTSNGIDDLAPDVDGDGTDFLVAYQRRETSGSDRHDIYARKVTWDGTQLVNSAEVAVKATVNDDEKEPAVGFLGAKFVVVWADHAGTSNPMDYDIRALELNPSTCVPCGTMHTFALASGMSRIGPEIASRHSARASNSIFIDGALVVFSVAGVTPPFSGNVAGQVYEAMGNGAPITDLGGGCGNAGLNRFSSPAVLGNSEMEIRLVGASPNAAFMARGLSFSSSAVSCGACTIMNNVIDWAIVIPSSPGTASRRLGIPCDAAFLGLPLFTQWAVFLSGANPCPLVPAGAQVSFSNRLRTAVGQ